MKSLIVGVLLTLAIVTGLTLFMKSRNMVVFGRMHRGALFQPTGDPPVTVSDGSLHAHSKAGWASNAESAQITPAGNASLKANCSGMTGADDSLFGTSNQASVTFWADDTESLGISPPGGGTTQIDIKYDSADTASPTVTIKASASSLTIVTADGAFLAEPSHSDNHDRAHSRDGQVEQITISGANYQGNNQVWTPQNPYHPHFTLGFCFK
jgi:hypothetical protein